MKAEQVDQALCQKFLVDGERLVFWHDPNSEFVGYVEQGLPVELHTVTVLDVTRRGGLSTKLLLEKEDTAGKYLLYSVGDPPAADEDWLLDIRVYSAEFHADVASVWLQELGLSSLYLRDHLRARAAFLRSQERRRKLKRLIASDDDEAAIDLKMMAVLVGAEVANLFSVLRALCHGHVSDAGFDLSEAPKVIGQFDKMGLSERFWQLVSRDFGYSHESPSVAGLVRRLFVSELIHETKETRFESLAHFELPSPGRQNAVVFLTQWRDSSGSASSFDSVSKAIAAELHMGDILRELPFDALTDVFTFWEAEPCVVSGLKTRVLEDGGSVDVDTITTIATDRKAGHWLGGPGCDTPERRAMSNAYDAIVAAAELFALRTKYQHSLAFESPQELLTAYRDELYRFDQLYRLFWINAKASAGKGWDLLKSLAEEVEGVYDYGFLQPLGLEWGRLLDEGFLESWRFAEMPSQQDFYAEYIEPILEGSERRRAYVIISDALRYEVAQQLTEELNGRYLMNAELSAMLGTLPSYTSLGMASLLPSERIGYGDKGDVLVDGRPVVGVEARDKQLATVEGMACKAKTLLEMNKDEARDFTDGKRVIYIYHNVIDARGDSASTESETFEAVDACISELADLVKFCVSKLYASTVWVTADHGFLYQEEAPGRTDKSELKYKPEQAVKSKKRYIIGHGLGTVAEAHHGSCQVTAGTEDEMEFWVPRGTNRFHFAGGARFVHGGAMPQEIVVPLIKARRLTGREGEASRIEKVSVQVLGTNHKITTPKYRFELIQTNPVGERLKPITLRAAVYDGAQVVTSVETVTFDSTSDSIDERKKSVRLELRSGEFDKSKPYRLVLRDAETDAEVHALPVVIDRSFDDDF